MDGEKKAKKKQKKDLMQVEIRSTKIKLNALCKHVTIV